MEVIRLVKRTLVGRQVYDTFLFVDLHAHVDVDADDDQVADDVERANTIQDHGIFERHLLARLHHHQDDDQVGTVKAYRVSASAADADTTGGCHTLRDSFCRLQHVYISVRRS